MKAKDLHWTLKIDTIAWIVGNNSNKKLRTINIGDCKFGCYYYLSPPTKRESVKIALMTHVLNHFPGIPAKIFSTAKYATKHF